MNREQQYIISGFAILVIAGLLLIFMLLPRDEPIPVQPVGEEITDQPQDGGDDETVPPQDLMRTGGAPLRLSDNVTITIFHKVASPIGPSGGNGGGGGGGGGGGSRDRTPPEVTGIFSRPPDIITNTVDVRQWYTHPFFVTWVGKDDRSGIDFCDPPTNYSEPDGISIVLEGHCTDRAGNVGTGHVTFSYNSTLFVPSFSYDLMLSSNTINAGSDITGTAKTNDTSITQVVFFWKDPLNNTAVSNVKPVTIGTIRTAIDIFTAQEQNGVWTLDAHFQNATGDDVEVLSKTFNVISPAINYVYSLVLDKNTVEINNPIQATAGTNDTTVTEVVFVWSDPETKIKASHAQSFLSGTAQDSFIPDALGEWKVDARFNNDILDDVAIKSRFFIVVPDDGGNGGSNHPPVADAGSDQSVIEGEIVTLNGTASSDPDGDDLTFSWKQTNGASVGLNDVSTVTPSFTAPKVTNNTLLTFELRVTDGFGGNSTDSVNITVLNTGDGGEQDNQGCSPGFWKEHTTEAVWGPTGFSTNEIVASIFQGMHLSLHNDTLEQTLNYDGGPGILGAEKILLRSAVAALLNSAHPDIDYPKMSDEVIAEVNEALQSDDRDAILDLKDELDADNNLGCGIDANGDPIVSENSEGREDHEHSGEKDKSDSGSDDKEHKNDHNEKGANDSGQHGSGSHNDSASEKKQGGADDDNSGGNNNKAHDSSGEGHGRNQASADNGSGQKEKGNDGKASSLPSGGAHDSSGGDKDGKDNDHEDGGHDKKSSRQ